MVACCVIHLAAIVYEPVTHDEVVHMQYHIVPAYLIEHLLGDVHRGSLVLDDDAWAQCAVIYYRIAPAAHTVEFELYLVGHERLGESLIVDEKMYEMLAYPLLGCQCYILAAYDIEDERLAVLLCYFFLERR